jgi:hypothetical protein
MLTASWVLNTLTSVHFLAQTASTHARVVAREEPDLSDLPKLDNPGGAECATFGPARLNQTCSGKQTWAPSDCPKKEERKWKEIDCSSQFVQTSMTAADRWNGLKAYDAWCDILDEWPLVPAEQARLCRSDDCFPEFVSNKLNGKPGFACSKLASANLCRETIECHQHTNSTSGETVEVSGAGAYLIFNSFVTVSTVCSKIRIPLLVLTIIPLSLVC